MRRCDVNYFVTVFRDARRVWQTARRAVDQSQHFGDGVERFTLMFNGRQPWMNVRGAIFGRFARSLQSAVDGSGVRLIPFF
jgi:hypothetical protein